MVDEAWQVSYTRFSLPSPEKLILNYSLQSVNLLSGSVREEEETLRHILCLCANMQEPLYKKETFIW